MPEQKRIPCPECRGDCLKFTWHDWSGCACKGSGTIPDRRAPSAAEDALRAEVAALKKQLDTAHKTTVKYIEEDNAGYLAAVADVARLQAELEKYTEPLTDEQMRAASAQWETMIDDGSDYGNVRDWDAAIRAAREGER